jgi:hypothetical protein
MSQELYPNDPIRRLAATTALGPLPYPGYALSLPYKPPGAFWNGRVSTTFLGLPGATFARSGTKYRYGSDGILYSAVPNQPLITNDGYWIESGFTNLLANSLNLSTQNVFVTGQAYTLSFYGTGTITLSGPSTAGPLVGTGGSNRAVLTFTPTTGMLVLTVTGSVTMASLVVGVLPGPIINTNGSPASVGLDNMGLSQPIPTNQDGLLFGSCELTATAQNQVLVSINDGTQNNRLLLYTVGASLAAAVAVGGVVIVAGTALANFAGTGRVAICLRQRGNKYTIFAINTAGQLGSTGESAVLGFPIGMNHIDLGSQLAQVPINGVLKSISSLPGTFSDAETISILTGVW